MLKWINVYVAGHWHKIGKPGTCNLHGGDVYNSHKEATDAIEQPHLWVATVSIEIHQQASCSLLPDVLRPDLMYCHVDQYGRRPL